ncbi:MAG: hypothetical protein ABR509_04665 [Candidatus Limnocylindria bacterium]
MARRVQILAPGAHRSRAHRGMIGREIWIMPNLDRWLAPRRGGDPAGDDDAAAPVPSEAERLAEIRREREIHQRLVAELARRGPEATAEDVYGTVVADVERRDVSTSAVATPVGAPPDNDSGAATPAWAEALIEEQRATNRRLSRLVKLLERREDRPGS